MPATHRKASGSGGLLEALDERARARPVDNFSSIQTYYRSAALWARQADLYRQRYGGEEQLYVMLMRYVSLVVEALPKHRAFSAADPKYRQLREDALRYLEELERLRSSLKLAALVKQLAGPGGDEAVFLPTKSAGTVPLSAGNLPELHWDAAAAPAPPPSAGAALGVPQPEGFDLLAGLGVGGAAAAAVASSSSALLPALQQPAFPDLPELSPGIRLPAASQATLARHALLPAGYGGSLSAAPAAQQRPAAQQQQQQQQRPLYPELAALEPPPPPPPVEASLAALDVGDGGRAQQGAVPPPQLQPSPYNELGLGPQEVGVLSAPRPTQPLPPDATCCAPGPGAVVPAPPQGGVQEVKRLQTLRDVHVSVALMDEFMRYAVSNTRRGIESCGILAGSLSADDAVFTITTLIVPKQTGTTDTVEMLGEEEIFEVQDSRALYPLGWIHTHPTQTCFLSSVDVHTHCGFQTMLDEAVAIVMAPKDPSKRVGIFRLSTPGGLKLVQRCPQRGFHAHPPTDSGQPVYELCGHVYLNPRASYDVVDLR